MLFKKKKKQPYYCFDEAIELIMNRTGIKKNVICEVLKVNDMYLKQIGVLDMTEEDIEYTYDYYKEKEAQ